MSETMPPCFRNPDFLADYCCKGDMMPLLVVSSNQKKVGSLALTGLKLKAHNHLSRCASEIARSFTFFQGPAARASLLGEEAILC
jgi:hypothetical protein